MESIKKWMLAVKPLIKCETEFLDHTDDLVAVNKGMEEGILEELLEGFVTKTGWGLKVSIQRRCVY